MKDSPGIAIFTLTRLTETIDVLYFSGKDIQDAHFHRHPVPDTRYSVDSEVYEGFTRLPFPAHPVCSHQDVFVASVLQSTRTCNGK